MEKKKPGIIAAIFALFCVCLLTACTKDGKKASGGIEEDSITVHEEVTVTEVW